MSVLDIDKVDGIALNNEEAVVLLLTDHLDWENEYEHLTVLQEKINAYIAFLEGGQYKEIYPNNIIKKGIIEIHFQYELTQNAINFLQTVQDQVVQLGITIQCYITEDK